MFAACGQTKTENQDINNVKTDKHINISGTRLFIVPPADFKIATSFIGLQKGDNASLLIQDLVGTNYFRNATNFSKEEFEKYGAKNFEYKKIKVNGFPAIYISEMQNIKDKNKICLVFGDSSFATVIYASYPSSNNKTGEEIQKSIKTIYYDKNFKVDNPLSTASFTLDESKSIFKFSKLEAGAFIYSVGGADTQSSNNEPFIMVVTIPYLSNKSPKDFSEDLISDLEEYGRLTDVELNNISTANVNGLPAYEVEIYGKKQTKNILIYQLIVIGTDKVIAIQGFIKSDFDNNLREIKNLARTIKLK